MARKRCSRKRSNKWFYTAFAFVAAALMAIPTLQIIGDDDLSSYAALIMFGASAGFTGFCTTGAIKQGEFVQKFYTASRQDSPISFWFCALIGYVVTLVFASLFILELAQN